MIFKSVRTAMSLKLMDGTNAGTRLVNKKSDNIATYFSNGKKYRIHIKPDSENEGTIVDESPLPGADLIS